MTTKDEALKLALDALEETRNALAWFYDSYPEDVTPKGNELLPHVEVVLADLRVALTSNSRALEQPAQGQEPVAWRGRALAEDTWTLYWGDPTGEQDVVEPLYTTPPAATVQEPLTDEQIKQAKPVCADFVSFRAGVRYAEARYKEKQP